MVQLIRHTLIVLLDIEKYATREGETVNNVELLGEGSFAKVLGLGPVAAKIISDTERVWVHKAAVANSLAADREEFGPAIFGYGRVQQTLGGHFAGTVIFMERLQVFENVLSDAQSEALLEEVGKVSKHGFHNDIKMPNILRRDGRPVLIDFDLMSQWSVKVAVSSSCIEHDFQEVLEPAGEVCTHHFREYYDLFALSLTLEAGPLYQKVLKRLRELWVHLEDPVLKPLLEVLGPERLSELPFEVLIRVPLRGVSVCLLDLRGNLFVHLEEAQKHIPDECSQLPQLLKSNGVYWPMEA